MLNWKILMPMVKNKLVNYLKENEGVIYLTQETVNNFLTEHKTGVELNLDIENRKIEIKLNDQPN